MLPSKKPTRPFFKWFRVTSAYHLRGKDSLLDSRDLDFLLRSAVSSILGSLLRSPCVTLGNSLILSAPVILPYLKAFGVDTV